VEGGIFLNYYQKQDHVKLTPEDTTSAGVSIGYLKRNCLHRLSLQKRITSNVSYIACFEVSVAI
jgi:hypothetical protein